jgi:malonyl-CoA decarboxylase
MNTATFLKRLLGGAPADPRKPAAADLRSARRVATQCHALLSERGEVSGARLALEALEAWRALGDAAQGVFFDLLVADFSPDPAEVQRAAEAYREDPGQDKLIRLQEAVESPRQELFRRLNMATGGTAQLVAMRKRLLRDLRGRREWLGIEADLSHLLSSWFNRGFLTLQRIDWRTSALVLEKLIEYEAVHAIQGWHDLRRRLQADRRCYAYFHHALPDEPLIFIEVALTDGLSSRVQPLLDPDSTVVDPARADCAIFYSITNCQEGLRGVSFGNLLIKQVAQDLGREFPRLKVFATLSPVPGFRRWLEARAKDGASGKAAQAAPALAGSAQAVSELAELLGRLEAADWPADKALAARAQKQLAPLCAHYLLEARQGREPLDPVARFHLGNGARLERLNWLGDVSAAGMARSLGVMVNYVYRLGEVESNHEAYAREGRIAASGRLLSLAREAQRTPRD